MRLGVERLYPPFVYCLQEIFKWGLDQSRTYHANTTCMGEVVPLMFTIQAFHGIWHTERESHELGILDIVCFT